MHAWPITTTALKATVVTRGPAIAWKPTTRTGAGRTVVTYDLANLQPYDDGAVGAPVDWIPYPMIGIATGASWAAIAADYRALVEAKLAAPVTVPADLLAATPRATVDRIVAWLHGRVRYTGIELSQSAIVPFAPADTLARGFGDCKDKATLLAALSAAAADVGAFDRERERPGQVVRIAAGERAVAALVLVGDVRRERLVGVGLGVVAHEAAQVAAEVTPLLRDLGHRRGALLGQAERPHLADQVVGGLRRRRRGQRLGAGGDDQRAAALVAHRQLAGGQQIFGGVDPQVLAVDDGADDRVVELAHAGTAVGTNTRSLTITNSQLQGL